LLAAAVHLLAARRTAAAHEILSTGGIRIMAEANFSGSVHQSIRNSDRIREYH
jgi:hypothetical protein